MCAGGEHSSTHRRDCPPPHAAPEGHAATLGRFANVHVAGCRRGASRTRHAYTLADMLTHRHGSCRSLALAPSPSELKVVACSALHGEWNLRIALHIRWAFCVHRLLGRCATDWIGLGGAALPLGGGGGACCWALITMRCRISRWFMEARSARVSLGALGQL